MRVLVTGVAGFVGSHLAERLLADGHEVLGVDAFTTTYAIAINERNVTPFLASPRFRLERGDLTALDLPSYLEGVDAVFHFAGEPGVRASWGRSFARYLDRNVAATQCVLEAARARGRIRVVFASSSSVYGNPTQFPTPEGQRCQPLSPYGVTKLAAEQLCQAYGVEFGVPTVVLRFFTVYGPRQRPDMAIARFIASHRAGRPVTIYGDGSQIRDLTYVSDAVDATVATLTGDCVGGIYNVGGCAPVSVLEIVERLGVLTGRQPDRAFEPVMPGDVSRTQADCSAAQQVLGYCPRVGLDQGLALQLNAAPLVD